MEPHPLAELAPASLQSARCSLFQEKMLPIAHEVRRLKQNTQQKALSLADAVRLGNRICELNESFWEIPNRAKLSADVGLLRSMRWRIQHTAEIIREHPIWMTDGKSQTISAVLRRWRQMRKFQKKTFCKYDFSDDDISEDYTDEESGDEESISIYEADSSSEEAKEIIDEKTNEETEEKAEEKTNEETGEMQTMAHQQQLSAAADDNNETHKRQRVCSADVSECDSCDRILRVLQTNNFTINGRAMCLQRVIEWDETGCLLPPRYVLSLHT